MKIIEVVVICLILSVFSIFAQTPNPTPDAEKFKNDAEYRKKWEEYEKQLAEVQAKNKQIAETNAKINVLFEEANKAFQNKEYEVAVKKYDAAIGLDDYWGMLTVILNNKALALRMIGTEKYNNAIKSKKNPSPIASPYFSEA